MLGKEEDYLYQNSLPLFNLQYALDILLHIEITSKQDTLLHHFNSPERCYASFQ